MKFALFQFAHHKKSLKNTQKIVDAIITSKENGADILLTQECALSGYPPIETPSIKEIDFNLQDQSLERIASAAKEHQIYVFLGLLRKDNDQFKNSIAVISPEGIQDFYDKRALWGWDIENYVPGTNSGGTFDLHGVKLGIRICFDIRFPELFRELYRDNVHIAFVAFCDICQEPNPKRLQIMKSHLITRATENAFTVISVNSATFNQTVPTCVIDPDGNTLVEAVLNQESITHYDYKRVEPSFSAQGRIHVSNRILGI